MAMSISGSPAIRTPISTDTSLNIQGSWLRFLGVRSYQGKKYIIATGRGMTTALRISSYGLEDSSLPELG